MMNFYYFIYYTMFPALFQGGSEIFSRPADFFPLRSLHPPFGMVKYR